LHSFPTRRSSDLTSTLMGLDAFPAEHPLHLGMLGMHGTVAANRAVHGADLLISLGMRFSDRVTGNKKSFSPNSFKIHIDIDNAELNKNIRVDIPVCSSVEDALTQILKYIKPKAHTSWHEKINNWAKHAPAFKPVQDGRLTPQEVIRAIDKATD